MLHWAAALVRQTMRARMLMVWTLTRCVIGRGEMSSDVGDNTQLGGTMVFVAKMVRVGV